MLEINGARLLDDLEALGRIGRTPDGGVSRPAMSPADVEARAWFRQRIEDAGLEFHRDGAGNLSAVLPAKDDGAPTLLAGSHLDTVPNGGRFDGALGTLAALEALRTLRDADLRLPLRLEAISFTDEEGALFGLLGSQAAAGRLSLDQLERARGGHAALEAGFSRLGIDREGVLGARREPGSLVAFVELHIEQGTRLTEAGVDIGVVASIVGIRSYWLRFLGTAGHAGTLPMERRADALWGAAEFVREARERVSTRHSPGVVNCGQLTVQPGAFNIVPAEARLALEIRHGTESQLDAMENDLLGLAQNAARGLGLTLEVTPADRAAPTPMDETVMGAVKSAASALGLSHQPLMSFAGHDAQVMATIAPSAMLFVPSVDGISHNPQEFTRPQDVVNGANTLLHTLLRLADPSRT